MPTAPKTSGIYCLANDVVIEWFEMFIRSYQLQNAALPLTVIPYDGNTSRLRALQKQFRFELMDESRCAKFDELAMRTMGSLHAAGMYRKLACFYGEYDTFIFLDSDIAVTTPLQRSLDAFIKSDYDFVYFDFDIDAAYKPAFAAKMIAEYQSHGFNAGAFMSRKGVFREEELWPLADRAAQVRDGLITGTIDQPYFNYIMDVTGRRQGHIDTLLPELARKAFARQPFHFDPKTRRAITPDGKLLTFIHWCGCAHPTMFRKEIFLHYRTLGMTLKERLNYKRQFYYLRFRRNLKRWLLQFPPTAKLLELREQLKRP